MSEHTTISSRGRLNDRSDFATISEAFEHQARNYGSRTFLKQKRDKVWREFSWTEIAEAAGRLRAGLGKFGIKPGDRVAILSDNSPEWVIADQAILGLGAIVVPLYTTISAEETRHVINDSGTRIVAANGNAMVDKILALGKSVPALEAIIAMHPGAAPRDRSAEKPPVMTLESASADPPAPVAKGSSDDLATFIYTSGTTGASKGVMLSHGNILSNCKDVLRVLGLHDDVLVLSFLPVAHSFERIAYYTVVRAGGQIAYAEGLTHIASNLLEIKPTMMMVVPRLLETVYMRVRRTVEAGSPFRQRLFEAALKAGKRAASYRNRNRSLPPLLALQMAIYRRLVFHRIVSIFGGRMRLLVSGGAPLSPEIQEFLAAAELPLVEGYGLTEASPVVSVNLPATGVKIGTVGHPLPSVEVKTADDGELLVRGPNVMKGYFGLEQETRETIDSEGWLHTGDLVEIDSEGFIRITDRKKEIIVLSGGKNVSPAYLENKLVADSYIAQACVVGDNRKHLAALLVPNIENLQPFLKEKGLDGKPVEELVKSAELRALYQSHLRELNKQLSDIEAISAFSLLPHPFTQENEELTPTLKLRRKIVQAHYRDRIEAMYRD